MTMPRAFGPATDGHGQVCFLLFSSTLNDCIHPPRPPKPWATKTAILLLLLLPQILFHRETFPRRLNASSTRTKWLIGPVPSPCWVSTALPLWGFTGLILLLQDTFETFFGARIDLIQRTLTKHSDRLKIRAEEAMNKMKTPGGEDLAENLDRERQKFKLLVRINHLWTGRPPINVLGDGLCRFNSD